MSELLQVFHLGEPLALETMVARTVQAHRGRFSEAQLLALVGGPVDIRAAAAVTTARASRPAVGVVTLFGLLLNGMGFGKFATDVAIARQQVRDFAGSSSVDAILLVIDSPGGTVGGIEELATEILNARRSKPVVAGVVGMAASAAYWAAAAADTIVATPSGLVGSIGVYAAHEDLSGQLERDGVKVTLIASSPEKVEGNPFAPLSEPAEQQIRRNVMTIFRRFVGQVAEGRGVSTALVEQRFGRGRTVLAREALAAGMIDQLGVFETAVDVAAGAVQAGRNRARVLAGMVRAGYPIQAPLRKGSEPSPDQRLALARLKAAL